jgi:hypothetical protein
LAAIVIFSFQQQWAVGANSCKQQQVAPASVNSSHTGLQYRILRPKAASGTDLKPMVLKPSAFKVWQQLDTLIATRPIVSLLGSS